MSEEAITNIFNVCIIYIMSAGGESKGAREVKVLTWNMCFGCMDPNEARFDASAKAIAQECVELASSEDSCLGRAKRILATAFKRNYDFIALQEEVNIHTATDVMPQGYSSVTNSMTLDPTGLVVESNPKTHRYKRVYTSNITTIFNSNRYTC